jgi:hypothetical protein
MPSREPIFATRLRRRCADRPGARRAAKARRSPSMSCGALPKACQGRYRDVVPVLALAGLRWGELAGLQVGDRVSVPGPGLRLRRTLLASGGGGALSVDTLKSNRGRGRAPGPGPGTHCGSLEFGQGAGCLVVRGATWRAAAGVELETPGWLECCHRGGRAPGSGCITCVIPPRRSGRPLAPIPRWCSGFWGMPRRR